MSLAALVAVAFAVWIGWIVLYNLYISPLAKFPGPRFAACTDLQNLYWTSTGQYHYKLKDPQAWKDIYGHRKSGAGSFLKDPKFYLQGPRGPNIINANDADHSRIRRLLSHAFSEKALREQEDLVQSYVNLLIQRLESEIAASRPTVDMTRWYNFTTFDMIGDLAFGEPFECLLNSDYHPWVQMVFGSLKILALQRPLAIYPFLAPIVRKLTPKKLTKMREEHFALTGAKVHRRLEMKTERPDFMSYVLRFDDERSMSPREMEANAAILILAGSETTASLLSGFTYYILANPSTYKKLISEIRESFESYADINFTSTSQLTYLNAALEEAMRVYPPVPGTTPRVVPPGGAIIDDKFIPEGTSVSGAHYSTYHSASHFEEADSFIPERWICPREKKFESDNRAVLQAFSLGPRNCLGKNLAYAEMILIAAKVLWSFDMTLDEASLEWNIQRSYNIWEKKPLLVKLSQAPRKN